MWVITSLLEIEHNCGRKGGLFNCLTIVETKACKRYLSDSKELSRLVRSPCPGGEEIGCEEVWSYENRDVEFVAASSSRQNGEDGLSKFYD